MIQVKEPTDVLGVDEYVELTRGSKPVILISYEEIYSTHELILGNADALVNEVSK